jgi:hypothetical protein
MSQLILVQCHEASGLPQMRFNFTPLSQLETLGKDSIAGTLSVTFTLSPYLTND